MSRLKAHTVLDLIQAENLGAVLYLLLLTQCDIYTKSCFIERIN